MNILSFKNVSKIYGDTVKYTAINNFSFSIDEGELVAIMGPSGSGKSTLLNLVAGILSPTSGEIMVSEKNISTLNEDESAKFRRTQLGFVFQDFNLVDTLTIEENIMLPLMLKMESASEMKNKSNEIAIQLGIEKFLSNRTYEVSGGQAQRAAIARAVIHEPILLLADEPTGNLDSASATEVMNIITRLNKEQFTTSIVVTHDVETASYCNRVVFLKDGKLYNEIHKGESQTEFYNDILNALKVMGGV